MVEIISGPVAALEGTGAFDVLYWPIERRGGAWGCFRETGAGSRFVAPNVRTKRDAIAWREARAKNESGRVGIITESAK